MLTSAPPSSYMFASVGGPGGCFGVSKILEPTARCSTAVQFPYRRNSASPLLRLGRYGPICRLSIALRRATSFQASIGNPAHEDVTPVGVTDGRGQAKSRSSTSLTRGAQHDNENLKHLGRCFDLGFCFDRISRVHSQAGEASPQLRDPAVLSANTGCF